MINYFRQRSGYIYRKTTFGMTSLTIVYPTGSAYEKIGSRGIAHLMEHLITKPLDKYNTFFTRNCIESNAWTSRNYVAVYFKGLEEKLTNDLKQELVNAVVHGFSEVTEEMFNIEKNIVIEELTDVFNDPFNGHLTNVLYSRFRMHDPTGFIRDIQQFTYEDAKKLAEKVYTKPLRIIEVARKRTPLPGVEYVEDIPHYKEIEYKILDREILPVPKTEKAHVFLLSKKPVLKPDYLHAVLGMEMLTDGLESPFMQEIREKRGLTYDVSADIDYATHFSVMWVGMVTDKKNVKTLIKLLEDMSLNITRYLTKDRFDALIDQYKTYSTIKKLFKYSKTDNLIEMEIPHMTDRVSDMSYDRVVATMQKYFSDIEIVVR